jgi:DNA-binding MarR family transcriptional regulator
MDEDLYKRVDRLNLIMPQIIKQFHAVPSRPHSLPAVSVPQLRMLMLLEGAGHMSMGELARRASVTMPTATSSVNSLVSGRYVARRRSPRDRRVVHVSITAKGRKVLEKLHEERRDLFATIFGRLDAADQERFVRAFEDILAILRKLDEAADPGEAT